jgi:hypothetical protein
VRNNVAPVVASAFAVSIPILDEQPVIKIVFEESFPVRFSSKMIVSPLDESLLALEGWRVRQSIFDPVIFWDFERGEFEPHAVIAEKPLGIGDLGERFPEN